MFLTQANSDPPKYKQLMKLIKLLRKNNLIFMSCSQIYSRRQKVYLNDCFLLLESNFLMLSFSRALVEFVKCRVFYANSCKIRCLSRFQKKFPQKIFFMFNKINWKFLT